ncbi:hypothetical protein [Microbacterium thalli]|uniref:hypothetical protein n=1 Tax=Microbacterium thalli TaxID=3027921 RepID=UPI002364FE4B|nr:hypothetical protein [Microbacterium thalli]MDD7930116.1 hypothetical protein [Microbacterium thalli]
MITRVVLAAAVVLLAVLVTPEMLEPVVNSADFIVALAPLAVVAIFAARRPQTPAGDLASPSASASPNAESPAGSPQ